VCGNLKVGVGKIYLLSLSNQVLQQDNLLRIYHAKVGVEEIIDPSNQKGTKEL
jgi:hypothetical protein